MNTLLKRFRKLTKSASQQYRNIVDWSVITNESISCEESKCANDVVYLENTSTSSTPSSNKTSEKINNIISNIKFDENNKYILNLFEVHDNIFCEEYEKQIFAPDFNFSTKRYKINNDAIDSTKKFIEDSINLISSINSLKIWDEYNSFTPENTYYNYKSKFLDLNIEITISNTFVLSYFVRTEPFTYTIQGKTKDEAKLEIKNVIKSKIESMNVKLKDLSDNLESL